MPRRKILRCIRFLWGPESLPRGRLLPCWIQLAHQLPHGRVLPSKLYNPYDLPRWLLLYDGLFESDSVSVWNVEYRWLECDNPLYFTVPRRLGEHKWILSLHSLRHGEME